jgi:ethanolamine utilization protein EutA (predicted chaperonin)
MIFGVNATKTAIIIAETKGAGDRYVITAIKPIPFQVHSGDDLAELLQTLITIFDRESKGNASVIALLKCSSGRFGSCLEAIKGEAMVELAAAQRGHRVVKVAPQSLKKTLGCAADQKWRDRAAELFHPAGKLKNWSKAAAGAVAVAFKVAGERSQ